MEGLNTSEYDPNNLNSIFYEHMVVALRRALPDAIRKGVLGNLTTGDILLIMNDKLSAIVHIIELGNGFCSFQLRGIEFKGTYCQERELEAVTEASEGDIGRGCETCYGSIEDKCSRCGTCISNIEFLKPTMMASMRWRTWQVINTGLVLKTYNVISNNASSILNFFEQRKELMALYVKSIAYYLTKRDEIDPLFSTFSEVLASVTLHHNDIDPVFSSKIDADFDEEVDGITFAKFLEVYQVWIDTCINERKQKKKYAQYTKNLIESPSAHQYHYTNEQTKYINSNLRIDQLSNHQPTNHINISNKQKY